MRGVPVNVNYRYLEDELVYLLDNSDAEALLFHGSLGDQRREGPRPRARREAVDPGRRRLAAARTSRSQYEELIAAHEPMARIERSGDDLYFLYTGGTTGMPKGVMWRNEDLFGVLGDGAYPLVGEAPPDTIGRGRARSRRRVVDARREPRAPARVAADARHRRVHDRSRRCSSAAAIVTLVGRHFDAHELWADGAARAGHADGDRRRRVRQADGARARGGRGRRARRTTSRRSS